MANLHKNVILLQFAYFQSKDCMAGNFYWCYKISQFFLHTAQKFYYYILHMLKFFPACHYYTANFETEVCAICVHEKQ